MKPDERDQELLARLTARLEASLEEIGPEAGTRLGRDRLAALSRHGERRPRRLSLPYWMSAGRLSFAAVTLVAVSLFAVLPAHRHRGIAAEDLEVITAQEQVDLIQDLDFYRWLAIRSEDHPPQSGKP
jgi:GNAT superfamily N-acetyltransferase